MLFVVSLLNSQFPDYDNVCIYDLQIRKFADFCGTYLRTFAVAQDQHFPLSAFTILVTSSSAFTGKKLYLIHFYFMLPPDKG
jgi:hypothetical protein